MFCHSCWYRSEDSKWCYYHVATIGSPKAETCPEHLKKLPDEKIKDFSHEEVMEVFNNMLTDYIENCSKYNRKKIGQLRKLLKERKR